MSDTQFMLLALAQAREAAAQGEIPVGAVIVRHGQVIASGRNAAIGQHDPTAHAEIVALRAAAQALGNYRLDECEMFVTLEPCVMCSGALLQARLKRVVFGAGDAKTGAAGSVINVFEQAQLNHQTVLQGGVLAEQGRALLQDFFRQRRAHQKKDTRRRHLLREDALRTPDRAFSGLPGYPWAAHCISDLPALGGLRLHYLDENPQKTPSPADVPLTSGTSPTPPASPASLTYICLHASPGWSYQFRKMIPSWLNAGARVIAPDLVGYGKSDKPKKERFHSLAVHRQILIELVDRLDLTNVVLVLDGNAGLLGRTLPMAAPWRYRGVLILNARRDGGQFSDWLGWPAADSASRAVLRLPACSLPAILPLKVEQRVADAAPFPDQGHRAALRAFSRVPSACEAAYWLDISQQARHFWQEHWAGQSLMVVSSPSGAFEAHGVSDMQLQGEHIANQAQQFFSPAT